jgi:hypothetical protein
MLLHPFTRGPGNRARLYGNVVHVHRYSQHGTDYVRITHNELAWGCKHLMEVTEHLAVDTIEGCQRVLDILKP